MEKSNIDLWAIFFQHEKLTYDKSKLTILIQLAEHLATTGGPEWTGSYKNRLTCRRLVCSTAMDLGIDFLSFHRIGRGMLDIWNVVYAERYGSNIGTSGAKESVRRNVVTRLTKGQRS